MKLSHKDTVDSERESHLGKQAREAQRKGERKRERESDCLAETVENCGYALQEPLKGRLPARTIDYRNASHTVSQSEQVKLS